MTTGTKTPEIAVGEPLHRRLAGLRVGDQACDLRERGVGADRVARTIRRPPALTVAPATVVAGADLDGHGLAGQHAHVDGRAALLDDAVGGDLLAGADDEAVAERELLDGDAPLGAVGVERSPRPWHRARAAP